MTRTIKELCTDALQVQDACNLSGVAVAFGRAMRDLCAHVSGTDARNAHPIAILWADKIAHLTGTQNLGQDKVSKAYQWIHELLAKPDDTKELWFYDYPLVHTVTMAEFREWLLTQPIIPGLRIEGKKVPDRA